jgi:hypothetical protein
MVEGTRDDQRIRDRYALTASVEPQVPQDGPTLGSARLVMYDGRTASPTRGYDPADPDQDGIDPGSGATRSTFTLPEG